MSRRTLLLLAAGVIGAHLLFFYLISDFQPLPKVPYIPPPAFTSGSAQLFDPATHRAVTYSEYTVSSRLLLESHTPPPLARPIPPPPGSPSRLDLH